MKLILPYTIIALLWPMTGMALSCQSIFSNSSSPSYFLQPLSVAQLLRHVDLFTELDPESLNPSLNVVAYSLADKASLIDLDLPVDQLSPRDRLVETDYGYAIMDVDELRDWTLLRGVIDDPTAAKKFIDTTANTPGLYPRGITRESADWLRWSVFANQEALNRAAENLSRSMPSAPNSVADLFDISIRMDRLKRAEYRRMVRQREIFMFPFGIDVRLEPNEIAEHDAPRVLEILARYFIISKLVVPRPSGEYQLLSEYLDRDSLMLLSRFPEFLAIYPIFEGGQFSVEHEYIKIGRDDTYTLAKSFLSSMDVSQELEYKTHFIAIAHDETTFSEGLELTGFFRIEFFDTDSDGQGVDEPDLDDETFQRIFSLEMEKMDDFLARKTSEFNQIAGYNIPVATAIEDDSSEYGSREFIITFSDSNIPAHVLAAFFVFIGLS
jgi:hypothetical protein